MPLSLQSRVGWADMLSCKRTPEPHVHQIEPTNYCPYSCVMCPRSKKMTRPLGFMEMELYQKVIDEIAGYSAAVRSKEIELFHFGESLLHPRIHEMVGYASSKGLNTVLSVNAPHLTPPIAETVMENGLSRLIVSLDGYDEESYQMIRGENADFSKALSNVRHLIELKKRSPFVTETCVRMIRLNLNSSQLDRFAEEWEGNGISVEIRPFFPWTEKDLVSLGDTQKYPPGLPCPFPWQYLVVQWDGTVVPCCRDYNAYNRMGNAWTSTLREIWNNADYEAFRQRHRSGEYGMNTFCKGCMDIFYTEPDRNVTEDSAGTVQYLWLDAVNKFAQRPLIHSDEYDSSFSYEDAGEIVEMLAARLRSAGVCKGDRICVCSALHPEALLAFWASAMLGAVFVPLDSMSPPSTLKAIIDETDPAIIFTDSLRSQLSSVFGGRQLVVFDDNTDIAGTTEVRFSGWIKDGDMRFTPAVVGQGDPAVILYTSGTSGLPKGVVLSQGALYRSGELMSSSYGWRGDDIFLSLAELHTMSGLRNPAVAALHAGCAIVLASHSGRTNSLGAVDCIARHGITLMSTVPSMIRQLINIVDRVRKESLKSLRMILSTGSMLPEHVKDAFLDCYGIPLFNYYGLTETSGLCIGVLPGSAAIQKDAIGEPIGCRVLIVDDLGTPLGENETGELIISSENLMTGYYRNPELSKTVIKDGWFHTGDLAYRRPDGTIVLTDRKNDTFKDRRGELVHPSEIEQALESHPDVSEAGVCRYISSGEEDRCAAFIVSNDNLKDTDEAAIELRKFLLEKLGGHKVPTLLNFVETLPRGTNGKLLRNKLAELITDDKKDRA